MCHQFVLTRYGSGITILYLFIRPSSSSHPTGKLALALTRDRPFALWVEINLGGGPIVGMLIFCFSLEPQMAVGYLHVMASGRLPVSGAQWSRRGQGRAARVERRGYGWVPTGLILLVYHTRILLCGNYRWKRP